MTIEHHDAPDLASIYSPVLKATSPVLLEIELEVLGCDYGGTSWTDQEEANRFADLLGLAAGVETLEIGAGAGWPGLHLATITGARITLTDLPPALLRIARDRAAADRSSDRCDVVRANGETLPFADDCFDAVYHCDAMC